MTEIVSLFGPVTDDIPAVGQRLRDSAAGHHPLLGETLSHIFSAGGKRIRPALVLLSGKLGVYDRERLVTLAASLEVVHTATLVHDDTIDQALQRRGLSTISAVWNEKVAILVGDFLFAQSAELAAQLDSVPIMSLLSKTVMAMSSGELQQYAATRSRTLDEADYLQRIWGKTASLFSMCCEGAALISEQGPEQVEALRQYGTNLGIAFQIADDVLDFTGDEATLGKPAGSDLRQGTMTLPAILFAGDLSPSSPAWQYFEDDGDIDAAIAAIRASDAPIRAMQRAREYADAARAELGIFPPSESRDALMQLAEHTTTRTR